MTKTIAGKKLEQWLQAKPLLRQLMHKEEVFWCNPSLDSIDRILPNLDINAKDVEEANEHGAPVLGNKCMDLTMIDIGQDSGVCINDEVVLIGRQGDEQLSAEDLADMQGTINYEVVTALTDRVRRAYLNA